MMKNKFFSTWPETHNRISPRTGLGLGVEVSIPKYPTQYLPQNRSTWFMTYDLDEKKFPMYLAQHLCRNTITKVPGPRPTIKKLVGAMVQDLVKKKNKKNKRDKRKGQHKKKKINTSNYQDPYITKREAVKST